MLKRGATVLAPPLAELSQYVQIELIVSWNIDDIVRECAADDVVVRLKAQIAAQPGGASQRSMPRDRQSREGVRRSPPRILPKPYRDDGAILRGGRGRKRADGRPDDRQSRAVAGEGRGRRRSTKRLAELDKEFGERLHFRCIGPLPPYSFATVEVSLPSFEAIDRARRALSLGESADLAEIKSAYHRQIRQVHPDLTAAMPPETATRPAHRRLQDIDELCRSVAICAGRRDAGQTGFRFDRDTVEGSILVMVRRQDLAAARVETQP